MLASFAIFCSIYSQFLSFKDCDIYINSHVKSSKALCFVFYLRQKMTLHHAYNQMTETIRKQTDK